MDQQQTHQLKNSLIESNIIKSLAIAFLLFIFNSLAHANNAAAFLLPPNFHSVYSIEKFSTQVGNMQNTLNYKNDEIHYFSKAKASGVASLFIKADPKETSILNWPENTPLALPKQLSYDYFQNKKHKKNQKIKFSYRDNGITHIEGNYKNKPYTLQTDKIVWSRQMLPLLMSSDLQKNPKLIENSFYITDKGNIEKYTYTLEAKETLKFENKEQPVLKFKIVKEGSQRMSYAWLAKAYYYLPLKIEQYKNNELNVRMLLTQFKLNKDD